VSVRWQRQEGVVAASATKLWVIRNTACCLVAGAAQTLTLPPFDCDTFEQTPGLGHFIKYRETVQNYVRRLCNWTGHDADVYIKYINEMHKM